MLKPVCESLTNILKDKILIIPEYQRHYSWKEKQRTDLFEDIKDSISNNNSGNENNHFMATIVCLKKSDSIKIGVNRCEYYDVVDGQQRLTTLIILLKAISKKLASSSDNSQKSIAKDLDKLLFKSEGKATFPILRSNHDKHSILSNYLKNGTHSTSLLKIKSHSDNNLECAIKECELFVSSISLNTKDLLYFINNNLYFIFLPMENEGSVYTVFEVLNSRGLDVDWLDKCKSLLMGLFYEKTKYEPKDSTYDGYIKSIHDSWSNIYDAIGMRKILGYEIVKFAATLKDIDSLTGKVMSPEDALDFVKQDCISIKKIIEYTKHIEEVVKCLSILYDDKKLRAVTDVSQARFLGISIMLKYQHEENIADRNKILEQWERTSFKIYTLFEKDSRSKVGDYVRVARKIQRGGKSVDELIKDIAKIGEEFDLNKIDEELKNKDWYNGWGEELRYFFFKYEQHLKKPSEIWDEIWLSNVGDTIEHILPQDKNAAGWEHFTIEEHEKYLHSIGNLCLLSKSLNSQAYNHPFDFKKTIYRKANMKSLENVIACNVWNKEAIEERTERLIAFAKEQWKDLDV